jgi:hypothetical protein
MLILFPSLAFFLLKQLSIVYGLNPETVAYS